MSHCRLDQGRAYSHVCQDIPSQAINAVCLDLKWEIGMGKDNFIIHQRETDLWIWVLLWSSSGVRSSSLLLLLCSKGLASRNKHVFKRFSCFIWCDWNEWLWTRNMKPASKRSFSSSSVASTQGSLFTSVNTSPIPHFKVSALHWREAMCFGSPLGLSTDMMNEGGTRYAASSLWAKM